MSTYKWEPIARSYDPLKAGSIDGTDTIPHDHGIVRAMQAEYKPNKLVVGDPKATVFVGRLNPCTEENSIKKVFSCCGKIKNFRLVRDIITGFSRGYAFVEYYDKYDAVKAQRELDKTVIDDKEILVDAECERLLPGWIPRRLGGGLSGKKESGQLRFGGKERPFKKPILPFNMRDRKEEIDNRNSYKEKNLYYSRYRYSDRHAPYKKSRHHD
ncbi:U11/U12 small nuclear ribonucleoprotein 35 kDa protein-like [Stegodyphus dumicola]|uniref:U11/U12 small nuclear ribonucleoprotein 35 kDa protein-like n=1 Tax=Stegodyphus dumicola TaxID=202533 RepID=UPI0015A82D2B|nr:U11/U12 small nuclear ribonucleoprotein 35 kDa protein-like [Stegodyphus dumicola]XP_035233722.1 U11/U12 small nuclear ribonucleoprotein 35 kDa protein-like [Stegodyphus dumicola]XP_035233723.1 U11/U12 small nuclear ribonucleoprotein 35 kDa protein-like [Stegodyphus dumicola]